MPKDHRFKPLAIIIQNMANQRSDQLFVSFINEACAKIKGIMRRGGGGGAFYKHVCATSFTMGKEHGHMAKDCRASSKFSKKQVRHCPSVQSVVNRVT